jgi:hypothetical protein
MASSDSHSGPPLQLVVPRSAAAVASDADVVRGLIRKEEWAAVELWTRYGSLGFSDRGSRAGCRDTKPRI